MKAGRGGQNDGMKLTRSMAAKATNWAGIWVSFFIIFTTVLYSHLPSRISH